MVCLGKKCPACGSTQMRSRNKRSWVEGTAIASPAVCQDCGQRLTTFGLCTFAAENRQHLRYVLPNSLLLRLPGPPPQFARIKNISYGGICFDNLSCCLSSKQTLRVDIYNCNNGTVIEQLPVEIISTYEETDENRPDEAPVLTKGARFLNLTQVQKKLLADCIQKNGSRSHHHSDAIHP